MTSTPKRRLISLYANNGPSVIDFSHNVQMATDPMYNFTDV